MTRYFYDTEFVEDGKTIDLVSIGIAADDGREFYAISSEFSKAKFQNNPWLVENVLPSLPYVRAIGAPVGELALDMDHPDYKRVWPRWRIANAVSDFLREPGDPIELWAYYGAYDHVVMSWLWGPMVSRPDGIPMWTHDIMQLAEQVGVDGERIVLPEQSAGHHNALADARHVKVMWEALTAVREDPDAGIPAAVQP